MPDNEREEADAKFKAISQAYEILSDDDKREMYDTHGMAAFEKGQDGFSGSGPDLDDILAQMFGGGLGGGAFEGMHGSFGHGAQRQKRGKGNSELNKYEISLEELYKGKTTNFSSTKKVLCPTCQGSGGKEKAKAKHCETCKGRGATTRLRPAGPGMVTQESVACSTCAGRGSFFAEKDKCKKCKGARITQQKKMLELYIPPGSRQGERIVLAGEADQDPDDDAPGDIVFELKEEPHRTFSRAGADLHSDLHVSLSEALTGFDRTVIRHLDGRGIRIHLQQPDGKVLRPGQILKVKGEGMPVKRSDSRGDLYFTVYVDFPEDGWLESQAAVDKVRAVLPPSKHTAFQVGEMPETVDEVDFETAEDLDGFGAGSDDPRAAGAWEDDEEDDGSQAQCAQQ